MSAIPPRSPGRTALLWLCRAGMGLALLDLALTVAKGGRWTRGGLHGLPPAMDLSLALLLAGASVGLAGGFRNREAWKGFAGRLVLAGCSLGLAGLGGEAAIRGYYQRTQGFNAFEQLRELETRGGHLTTVSHSPLIVICRISQNRRLIYELRPNLDTKFGHRVVRTNAAGFRRDGDVPEEPPEGTFRIVGVGDSGMWGWGLDQGLGYLERMEALLNAREDGFRYEVLNFAVPGYNAQQEIEMLESRGLAYQPRVVVVGWNENDFDLPFFMYTRRNHFRTRTSYLVTWMFRRDRLGDLLRPELLKLGDMDTSLVDPEVLAGAGVDGVRSQFLRLRELARERGFHAVVVGPLDARVRTILAEVGLPHFNTYTDIDTAALPEEYAITFMHPRAGGHQVIAEHLVSWLDQKGLLPPAPPVPP